MYNLIGFMIVMSQEQPLEIQCDNVLQQVYLLEFVRWKNFQDWMTTGW